MVYGDILKFGFSSFVSFIVDFLLFSIFNIYGTPIILSNFLARVISSVTNYSINKRYVFESREGITSAVKYFFLAVGIFIVNTCVVYLLSDVIGMKVIISKIFTEVGFFLVSWSVQSKLVFNNTKLDIKEKFKKIKYILTRY